MQYSFIGQTYIYIYIYIFNWNLLESSLRLMKALLLAQEALYLKKSVSRRPEGLELRWYTQNPTVSRSPPSSRIALDR